MLKLQLKSVATQVPDLLNYCIQVGCLRQDLYDFIYKQNLLDLTLMLDVCEAYNKTVTDNRKVLRTAKVKSPRLGIQPKFADYSSYFCNILNSADENVKQIAKQFIYDIVTCFLKRAINIIEILKYNVSAELDSHIKRFSK